MKPERLAILREIYRAIKAFPRGPGLHRADLQRTPGEIGALDLYYPENAGLLKHQGSYLKLTASGMDAVEQGADMSSIQINRITNANIYVNGNNMLGTAEEIQLPDLSIKETEHKALGMIGTIVLPVGIDKLEGKIKWNSFYTDIWLQAGNPFIPITLMCRSSVDGYGSQGRFSQLALVTQLTVTMKKIPLGTFKQHDNAEFQSEFTATYVKQQLDGNDMIELDVMSNIFKIGGSDQEAIYRANIGG